MGLVMRRLIRRDFWLTATILAVGFLMGVSWTFVKLMNIHL